MIFPVPITSYQDTRSYNDPEVILEQCLSKSENIDILNKYNANKILNEDEQARLTSCVEAREKSIKEQMSPLNITLCFVVAFIFVALVCLVVKWLGM